jgi:ribosome-binding factor A
VDVVGANQNRRDRLGGQVRAVIAECLLFEVKDPRLSSVDVTDVVMSPDLGHAKVYYYARVDEEGLHKIQTALERAKSFLRRKLGREIRARVTPDLAFFYDDSIERGAEMDQLLNQARARDEEIAVKYRGNKTSLSDLEGEESDSSAIESHHIPEESHDD